MGEASGKNDGKSIFDPLALNTQTDLLFVFVEAALASLFFAPSVIFINVWCSADITPIKHFSDRGNV